MKAHNDVNSKFDYYLTIEFYTFHGAHGPPYDKNNVVYGIKITPKNIKEISFHNHEVQELPIYTNHYQPNYLPSPQEEEVYKKYLQSINRY